jgi:3-oxoacyl-[acyl-carrier-protein] synthase-3
VTAVRVGVQGLGAYVPERVIDNQFWADRLDTSDEWITQRSGIKRRHFAAEGETTVDLAYEAARLALDDAGITASELDEIAIATDTPEVYTPDTAAFLQHRLGAREIPCYDLGGSGCAGFLQALDIARARVLYGKRRVLVVGVELISRLLDWTDRSTIVLFGDGAGAMVLSADAGGSEILAARAGTDGSKTGILTLEAGGSRLPFSEEVARRGLHQKLEMNGRQVFKHAVARMAEVSRQVLEEAGVAMSDIKLVVPHQANLRILEAVAKVLDLPEDKLCVTVDEYGNTGSASVPLALWKAREDGRVQAGDLVLLTAFGAGFHWASLLLRL